MSSILQPGVTNPLASIFSYNNPVPNPTLGTGAFQLPSMQAPMASDLSSLGSGTFNLGQSSIPGFNTSFDPDAYLADLNRYSGGALDDATKVTDNGLGMNLPTFQLGLSGLMGLGNLYGAFQSNKLANKSFDYSKSMADKNYRNTVASYNTALEDQRNVRGVMEGKSQAQVQSEIDRNRLA